MMMLCYFYCVPLAWFVYYMLGPVCFIGGMFGVKRGIRNRRKDLRQTAFIWMFIAAIKMCLFDVHMLRETIRTSACKFSKTFPLFDCSLVAITKQETMQLGFIGMVLLVVVSLVLFHYFRMFMPDRKPVETTPEQVKLKQWVKFTFWMVIGLACWAGAPWICALVGGASPAIFKKITVNQLSLGVMLLLLIDFWKMESCVWVVKDVTSKDRNKHRHLQESWTPKDTLWMTVFLFLLTMGLAYVSNDILNPKQITDGPNTSGAVKSWIPDVDTSNPMLNQNQPRFQ
jgi:hypothetical protein